MNVLGLSFGYHDSSAALLQDGKLTAFATEERLTRQKHDAFYPREAIESVLKKGKLTLKDVDQVAYYEKNALKWSRVLSTATQNWPFRLKEFKTSMKTWLGNKLWIEAQLVRKLELDGDHLSSFEHHLSHAAQSFVGSGFKSAAILTVDAVGEWETTTLYRGSWEKGRPVFKKIMANSYPHSLGLFYSAITHFLGFKPMSDECTTMALSSFSANPQITQKMREIVSVDQAGQISLDQSYFQFDRYFAKPYTDKFTEAFGPSKGELGPSFKYTVRSAEASSDIPPEEQRLLQVAHAAQVVFEECMLKLASLLKRKTGEKNLCLAGGAALNCVANSRLMKEAGFEKMHIPTDPGDGGAAVGAAYLAHFKKAGSAPLSAHQIVHGVSQGQTYSSKQIEALVENLKPAHIKKYRRLKTPSGGSWNFKQKLFAPEETDTMLEKVAQHLHQGKVVGWVQRGVEMGPRALGFRSLLFKADDEKLAQKVSVQIKARAPFRPYALSMNEKAAALLLQASKKELSQTPMRYMQLAVPVKGEHHRRVKSGLHVDGTTRPQVVREPENSLYANLLDHFEKISGLGTFINTSFNESGYPIVEGPEEALLMFCRTPIDLLVVDNLVIEKELP